MKRRVQHIQMINQNKKIALTKYKRNAAVRICKQSVMKYSLAELEDISKLRVKGLRAELKAHSVAIPSKKVEMVAALSTILWMSCSVTNGSECTKQLECHSIGITLKMFRVT